MHSVHTESLQSKLSDSDRTPVVRPWLQAVAISWSLLASLGQTAYGERMHLRHAAHRSANFAAALESIQSVELQKHVDVLADDTFEGRQEGSRGGRAAGMYLMQHLEKAGLKGAGSQGFFQLLPSRGRNVLAVFEGSDPELKNEYVLIGAHYDHVGYGTPTNSYGPTGYIHNGADDNASGVASVLEIVDSLQKLPAPPRRSLLVAFWDGEENGLLGSKHWVSSPTVPLSQIVFGFNLDMIGRLEKNQLKVYGARTSPGLRPLLARSNRSKVELSFDWQMKANSDHHSLFQHNIPVVMFHTGLHGDYHRPSDDAEKLNYDGMQKVTRLLLESSLEVANLPQRMVFRSNSRTESDATRSALEQPLPSPAPRLGLSWSRDDDPGLPLSRVALSSAAARSGLRIGDRLVAFNGETIGDDAAFLRAVLEAPAKSKLTIVRDGQRQDIEVTLDGQPTLWGLAWRADSGQPGVMVLVRVVRHSAAFHADLAVGDRIYEANGERLTDSQSLNELLQENPTVELLVERRGVLFETTLQRSATE